MAAWFAQMIEVPSRCLVSDRFSQVQSRQPESDGDVSVQLSGNEELRLKFPDGELPPVFAQIHEHVQTFFAPSQTNPEEKRLVEVLVDPTIERRVTATRHRNALVRLLRDTRKECIVPVLDFVLGLSHADMPCLFAPDEGRALLSRDDFVLMANVTVDVIFSEEKKIRATLRSLESMKPVVESYFTLQPKTFHVCNATRSAPEGHVETWQCSFNPIAALDLVWTIAISKLLRSVLETKQGARLSASTIESLVKTFQFGRHLRILPQPFHDTAQLYLEVPAIKSKIAEAIEPNELPEIHSFLKNYFKALTAAETGESLVFDPTSLLRTINLRNPSPEQIAMLEMYFGGTKIKSA